MLIKRQKVTLIFLILLILLIFILFFTDGPSPYSNRIYLLFWDNGHILFFALVGWLTFILTRDKSNYYTSILTLFNSLIGGLVIEVIQSKIGRDANWQDVYRGVLGGLFSNLALNYRYSSLNRTKTVIALVTIVLLIALEQKQLLLAIKLEFEMRRNFPILSTFNKDSDLMNWSGNSLSIEQSDDIKGVSALKAKLIAKQKYSSLTLEHFSNNWRGYKTLHIDILLNEKTPSDICIRITDITHDSRDQLYTDRYNTCMNINQTLNTISIPLAKVEQAPLNRLLDLSYVSKITIFSRKLPYDRYIYISSIYLSK
ncbi:MAG: VanZ family protein [Ulvibacter sp.]|jgi:VanZ family protein